MRLLMTWIRRTSCDERVMLLPLALHDAVPISVIQRVLSRGSRHWGSFRNDSQQTVIERLPKWTYDTKLQPVKSTTRVCANSHTNDFTVCHGYQGTISSRHLRRHGDTHRLQHLPERSMQYSTLSKPTKECINCYTTNSKAWPHGLCEACYSYRLKHQGRSRPKSFHALNEQKSQSGRLRGPCVHCGAKTAVRWDWNDDLQGVICSSDYRMLMRTGALPLRTRPSDILLDGSTRKKTSGPCVHCEAVASPRWRWNKELSGSLCYADAKYLEVHGVLPKRIRPSDAGRPAGPCVHCGASSSAAGKWHYSERLQGYLCHNDYRYARQHGRLPRRDAPSDTPAGSLKNKAKSA